MFDHEIRWYVLIAVAVLLGLAQLASETAGLWFDFPARPDWLWGVAFFAVLRTAPTAALTAFAVCGLVRDAVLGPKLGSAAIAYILVGWPVLSWRLLGGRHGVVTTTLLAGVTAFFAAVLRHLLDYGGFAYTLGDRIFFISVGDGLLTGLGYLPLMLVLGSASFRPWRERSGY